MPGVRGPPGRGAHSAAPGVLGRGPGPAGRAERSFLSSWRCSPSVFSGCLSVLLKLLCPPLSRQLVWCSEVNSLGTF